MKPSINSEELWSLDHTLADIILPYLIAFKKSNLQSYPVIFEENSSCPTPDENLNPVEIEVIKFTGKNGIDSWKLVLAEIIWAFKQVKNDYRMKGNSQRSTKITAKYMEKQNKHYERIQRGMLFFGYFFSSLWD